MCCRTMLDTMGSHCPVPVSSKPFWGKRVIWHTPRHLPGHSVQWCRAPCPVDPSAVNTHLLDTSRRLACIILILLQGSVPAVSMNRVEGDYGWTEARFQHCMPAVVPNGCVLTRRAPRGRRIIKFVLTRRAPSLSLFSFGCFL